MRRGVITKVQISITAPQSLKPRSATRPESLESSGRATPRSLARSSAQDLAGLPNLASYSATERGFSPCGVTRWKSKDEAASEGELQSYTTSGSDDTHNSMAKGRVEVEEG